MGYDASYWIYLLFFQDKGRTVVAECDGASYAKGDVLQVMRCLRDYRAFNAALINGIPQQWRQFCPTVEACRSRMPADAVNFAVHDSKNAFHYMRLTLASRRFCVSSFRGKDGRKRFIMALGGDQGCAACALFFPV